MSRNRRSIVRIGVVYAGGHDLFFHVQSIGNGDGGYEMKNYNTERIELMFIFAGVFLGVYLFLIGCHSILEAIHVLINQ